MSTVSRGRSAEEVIISVYKKNGYHLVVNNFEYRSQNKSGRLGEIDCIFSKNQILVLVEVKFRQKGSLDYVLQQITKAKINRIYKSYQYFLSKNENYFYRNYQTRLDVAIICDKKLSIFNNCCYFDNF